MDCPRYPDSCRRYHALRCASARDRRDFSENAYPNPAQPRTRWLGATHGASGRAAQSRIFAYEAGTHVDRAAPGTLSLVGKTSRGTSSEPRAGQTNGRGVMECWTSDIPLLHCSTTRSLRPLTHAPGRDYCAFVHGRRGTGRAGAQDYAAVSDRARPWRTRFEFRAAIAGGEPESGRCVVLHSSGGDLSRRVVYIVA